MKNYRRIGSKPLRSYHLLSLIVGAEPVLYTIPVYRAGLRELEALGEVNLVAPNEIEK